MWRKLRLLLVRSLLLPIMPCFMWGPVTHPYIALKAFEKAKKNTSIPVNQTIIDAIEHHEDAYIYAANSPDAISTNHVLFNIISYDYAHNNIPNKPDGTPIFGYRLVAKALERLQNAAQSEKEKYKEELAFACGWLTHQISDWVAHYREVEREIRPGENWTFHGWANSHQILSPYFHHDILNAKKDTEHALMETFCDAYIMFTDTTNRFVPGKVIAYLPTQEDNNIISLVSETFHDLGCSKIPSKHLKKLREDFEDVIKGIQLGIQFLRHLQPGFESVVKEFVENNQMYIDEAIQMVVQNVLCISDEQLLEEVNRVTNITDSSMSISIVSARPESIVHRFAFGIGKALTPDSIDTIFVSPLFGVKALGPLIKLEFNVRDILRKELPCILDKLGGRLESTRALLRFAKEMISASEDIIGRARDAYCSELRPITAFDVSSESYDLDDLLEDMIEKRLIKIRFTPAKRTDKDTKKYLLNPATTIIRINGYLRGEEHAPFTVEEEWDDTEEILKCRIHLSESALRSDCLHIFADINDMGGKHSQYIDNQIRIR